MVHVQNFPLYKGVVRLAKSAVCGREESAVVSLHRLRIYLGKSHREFSIAGSIMQRPPERRSLRGKGVEIPPIVPLWQFTTDNARIKLRQLYPIEVEEDIQIQA